MLWPDLHHDMSLGYASAFVVGAKPRIRAYIVLPQQLQHGPMDNRSFETRADTSRNRDLYPPRPHNLTRYLSAEENDLLPEVLMCSNTTGFPVPLTHQIQMTLYYATSKASWWMQNRKPHMISIKYHMDMILSMAFSSEGVTYICTGYIMAILSRI